jgi:hypothetical protein
MGFKDLTFKPGPASDHNVELPPAADRHLELPFGNPNKPTSQRLLHIRILSEILRCVSGKAEDVEFRP